MALVFNQKHASMNTEVFAWLKMMYPSASN
jgi:hypothetical protein